MTLCAQRACHSVATCGAALLLATASLTRADLLGDGLADLEKSVDALPTAKTPPATTDPPVIEKPKVEGQTDGGGKSPVTGGGTPQVGKPNLVAVQWEIDEGADAAVKDGQMKLGATEETGAVNVTLRKPVVADFDVELEYVVEPAKTPIFGGGLGLRIDALGDWHGDQQISVDRLVDSDGDYITAAKDSDGKPAFKSRVKGSHGALRVQRAGDRFQIWARDGNAREWTDLGRIEAKLPPKVRLWLTVHANQGEVRATVTRLEVAAPAR